MNIKRTTLAFLAAALCTWTGCVDEDLSSELEPADPVEDPVEEEKPVEVPPTELPTGEAAWCEAEVVESERIPVDLVLVMDRSASMQGTLWNQSVTALSEFLFDPASHGMRAAVNFFPVEGAPDQCETSLHSTPQVDFASLPQSAIDLVNVMNQTSPTGTQTPIRPALEGALAHAAQHQAANPERRVVVVLATDGTPNGCGSDVAAIAQLATNGLANGVATYTIGINGANLDTLDAIAAAGGTAKAFDVSNDTAQLRDALVSIRGDLMDCEFALPNNPDLNTDKVNVSYEDGNGQSNGLVRAPTPAHCGSAMAWTYDDENNPQSIVLCPAACDEVRKNDTAKIAFKLGCDYSPL